MVGRVGEKAVRIRFDVVLGIGIRFRVEEIGNALAQAAIRANRVAADMPPAEIGNQGRLGQMVQANERGGAAVAGDAVDKLQRAGFGVDLISGNATLAGKVGGVEMFAIGMDGEKRGGVGNFNEGRPESWPVSELKWARGKAGAGGGVLGAKIDEHIGSRGGVGKEQ